nr:T9SS type A sorting domain-containing protein [uncultured Psychroserpens sp.]
MKSTTKIKLGLIILCAAIFALITLQLKPTIHQNTNNKPIKTSGAGKSMDIWSLERSYPYETISVSKYLDAYEEKRISHEQRSSLNVGQWESLGPQNIGGRTLCLAFHPTDPDIIFAGSASGGLWKTTTQGIGINAWEYIETGFPVLGVASIAIDPNDADTMYIGTGEVYGSGFAQPGTELRLTRGTYGIGILKSVDAGNTWSHELVFNENELKGVSDIEINPSDTSIIFAATSDGVYRTTDSGGSWTLVFNQPNCIDIEIDPNNTNILYVSQGNFNTNLAPNLSGIFKSTNGGDSFTELLDPGLLTAWSGNAKLSIDPTNSNTIYASIQVGFFNTAATTPAGIYKSINGGTNWNRINNQNIAQFQGWYSHDIAINPNNASEIINVGVDAWKSTDTGANFIKKSDWTTWEFGVISVDTPEGGSNYIHGDIHAVYYHPLVANKVFFATDGGVFSSTDNGETFVTNNGGLQTTQFYANMASSTTDPNFIIAGAQDNATYIYRGLPSWERTLGGDGMSASIRPDNDQIVFGSAQGLNMFRSTDGGASFPANVRPTLLANDYTTFSAPYEIAPSNNDIIYAGSTGIYRSIDNASSWTPVSFGPIDGSNAVTKIAVSPTNADIIYVSTAVIPLVGLTGTAKIMKSIDGGQTFTTLNGLPDRIAKDIEFDPNNENIIYATFSGFGSNHVYKTIDGGNIWNAIDNGLPDLPTNTVLIDPFNSDHVYVGNDLGVYFSENGGNTWDDFSEGLPEAVMVYDLNLSPANNKVRIATHGHGIHQRDLASSLSVEPFDIVTSSFEVYPNPSNQSNALHIRIDSKKALDNIQLNFYNALGQKVHMIYEGGIHIGLNEISWVIDKNVSAGNYFISIENGKQLTSKQIVIN